MTTVIEVAGKQYCLKPDQKIAVPHLMAQIGDVVQVKDVLNQKDVTVEVVEQIRAPKVVSRKFRNKTRYQRTKGHRQPLTVVVLKETKPEPKKAKAKE